MRQFAALNGDGALSRHAQTDGSLYCPFCLHAGTSSGGLPDPVVTEGEELVTSTWDVLSGSASLTGDVLVFDDLGQHQAPSTAEFLAARGCKVELATADRMVGAEMEYLLAS